MKNLILAFVFCFYNLASFAQWHHTSGPPSGTGGSNVSTLLSHGNYLFAGTQAGIYFTHDNGSTWVWDTTGFNIPTSMTYGITEFCVIGNTLVAVKSASQICSSEIGVNFWTQVGVLNLNDCRMLSVLDSSLFAVGQGGPGIFTSADTGRSWTPSGNGLSSNSVSSIYTVGTNLYAATATGVFKSVDRGFQWDSAGLNTRSITALAFDGINTYAAAYGGNNGFYFSNDGGQSWVDLIPDFSVYARWVNAILVDSGNVFIGTEGCGIFLSKDSGQTWNRVNSGLTDSLITSLAVVGDKMFAGTRSGVFVAEMTGLLAEKENPIYNQKISIYPNPFTSETKIEFSEEQEKTTITIFNTLGKEISTINFAGKELKIEKGLMRRGVYYIRMTDANTFTTTMKIIVD